MKSWNNNFTTDLEAYNKLNRSWRDRTSSLGTQCSLAGAIAGITKGVGSLVVEPVESDISSTSSSAAGVAASGGERRDTHKSRALPAYRRSIASTAAGWDGESLGSAARDRHRSLFSFSKIPHGNKATDGG